MRLSEFEMSRAVIEMIERHHTDLNERQIVLDYLFEGIRGNNLQVENFINNYRTNQPILKHNYYPVGVIFLVGFDHIDITYTKDQSEFIGMDSGDYMYDVNGSKIRFPANLTSNMSDHTVTFHCETYEESKELRGMIYLMFGDCKISEHKL